MKILMEKQYDLKDIVVAANIGSGWDHPYITDFASFILLLLTQMSVNPDLIKFADFDENTDVWTHKDYIAEMLNDFYPRYYKYYAASTIDSELTSEICEEFWCKFFNVLNVTYPKYATIIKFYKNNEAKLMDSLNRDYTDDGDSSGTVTSRFNDTPQDGGLFEDDTHTTNVNETSSTSDSGLEHKETYNNEYMLDRLNRIRDNLSNLFTEWENKVATILWR